MKTNILITALAAMAFLVPGTAQARQHYRGGHMHQQHRIEYRMAARGHHGVVNMSRHRMTPVRHMAPVVHRHAIGTRFFHRPLHGRFVSWNRERVWLADGIVYRVVNLPGRGPVYVVVGYWR